MGRLARDPEVEALVDEYRAQLEATGQFAENEVTSPARAFLLRVGGASGWSRLALEQQCEFLEGRESRVVLWMIAAGHARARPELLVRGHQRIGRVAAWIHGEFHERFMQVAGEIGFDRKSAELQWWAVAKVAAVAGVPPDKLTQTEVRGGPGRATRRDPPGRPAIRASNTHDPALRSGGDLVPRRGDRRAAAQAQGEPGHRAR